MDRVAAALSRRRFLGLAAGTALVARTAAAQNVPFPILAPKDTVELEHNDRRTRLERLSQVAGIEKPEFFEYRIAPEDHGLPDYPVPIPVLRVVFRDRVFFDFDKSDLKPEAFGIVATIAESLKREASDVTLFVAGHTDATGTVDYNLQLGFRRSRAVAAELVGRGIPRAQVYIVSFGKALPIASNDTEDGRAQNRRVEFLFSARPEPIAKWITEQPVIACGEDRTKTRNDCPVDLTFKVVSVDLAPPQTVIPGTPPLPTTVGSAAPATTSIRRDVDSPKSVSIGEKVITIDLRQKIYTMPPPLKAGP